MNPKSHAKAYLEALFQPPSLSGTIGSRPSGLIRSASGVGLSASGGETNNYKPTKSSGLAVEGDKEDAEEDGEGKFDDDVASNIDPDVQAAITSAASISSASEDDEYDPSSFLGIQTTPSRPPSHSTSSTMHSVQAIMRILDDKSLDDEERIDRVRNALADRLGEFEGGQVVSILGLQ